MAANAKAVAAEVPAQKTDERMAKTIHSNWKWEETAWIYKYNVSQIRHFCPGADGD
jgi:hypothetical protein